MFVEYTSQCLWMIRNKDVVDDECVKLKLEEEKCCGTPGNWVPCFDIFHLSQRTSNYKREIFSIFFFNL